MKVSVLTWGCQLNQHRSEEIEGVLAREGYSFVDQPEDADVVVFNTCMVRGKAEEKVAGRLAQLAGVRRHGRPLLGVGGCMAQGRGTEVFKTCPAADFVFGTGNLAELPSLINRALAGERPVSLPNPGRNGEPLPMRRRSPTQAYVAVSDGCSHACAYCVVPFVRGPLRSRPLLDINEELLSLAQKGYKEVTLLGQNVDAYGVDRSGTSRFPELLRRAAQAGIPRVRFTSSHPAYISSAVLEVMADESAICEHLHLAVQSGSDAVLRAMGRGHTRAQLDETLRMARRHIPGINLTTDVIVGFPGETEADFEETMELLEEGKFGTVYAAVYSPRPHTRAAQQHDDVPRSVKRQRLEDVLCLARRTGLACHERYVGQSQEVLVEGYLPSKDLYYGKTRDFRTVLFPGKPAMMGAFVAVHVTEARSGGMRGFVEEAVG